MKEPFDWQRKLKAFIYMGFIQQMGHFQARLLEDWILDTW